MSIEKHTFWRNVFRVRTTKTNLSLNSSKLRWWRVRVVFWACSAFLLVGFGVYLRAEINRRATQFESGTAFENKPTGGTLIIAGGGPIHPQIRRQFIDLAGGNEAKIIVIPATSVEANERHKYRDPWDDYGVRSVDVLCADSREQADDPEFSQLLDSATGVWLGGGQQTWLAATYRQTRVESRLKEVLARKGVIGGTSAGAAIMSGVMIAGGQKKPTLSRGFDLIPGAIIDQHFLKRNRFRRLQTALQQHPDLIGFGIDEGTALQYCVGTGRFRVIGKSCVVACVPERSSDTSIGFHIEFLNPSDDFDVERLRRGDSIPVGSTELDAILMGE